MPTLKYWDGAQYVPLLGGGDVYVGPNPPANPVDIWIDSDAVGGTTDAYVLKAGDTMTGNLTVNSDRLMVGKGVGDNSLWFRASQGQYASLALADYTTGQWRWAVRKGNTAETGGDVGSDFEIVPVSDGNQYKATALSISRATGAVTIPNLGYQATSQIIYNSTFKDYTGRPNRFTKFAGMVALEFSASPTAATLDIALNAWISIGTVPVGFRPVADMDFPGVLYTGSSGTPVRTRYPFSGFIYAATGEIGGVLGPAATMSTNGSIAFNATYRQGN